MRINKSTTGQFYVAVQDNGNNDFIGMGHTPFLAIQDCLEQVYTYFRLI